jgi:Tol biopolymer transport system component
MRMSHDGQYIAYDQPPEENVSDSDIYLISVDGKHEERLVKHAADHRLIGWSIEGKGILFSSDRTGSGDMWFLPVSEGRAQTSPELVKGGLQRIIPMGLTQSGSFYYAQGGEMLDIYVTTVDSRTGKILQQPEKTIKRFEGLNSWPDYSFDGKYLAYVSTRSHSYQANRQPNILCIRLLETGEEREFTKKFRRLAGTRWAPDGKFLYLAAWDNQGQGIYRVNAHNGEFNPVIRVQPPASLHRHEISPDGNLLIYGRRNNQKEPYRIFGRNLTTGEEKQIYSGNERNMFSISPDGKRLALINVGKDIVLQVMPISGGGTNVIFKYEAAKNVYSPVEWSADGEYIFFVRQHRNKD